MKSVVENRRNEPEARSAVATRVWPQANRLRDLVQIALKALEMKPLYLRSIFGKPSSWLPPHRQYSEFNIIDPWQALSTARYLLDVTVPASAQTAPDWARMLFPPVINRRFWRPTRFFRQPDTYGGVCTFPDERWFYINGVATNHDVARFNAEYIAHLFHRPVSVIQNATDSLGLDLYECAIGKEFKTDPDSTDRKTMTEPAFRATTAILEALDARHTRRVIVIAHSQGTIIMANVLRALSKALRQSQEKTDKPEWRRFTRQLMGGVQTDTQKIVQDNLAHAFAEFTRDGPQGAVRLLAKLEIYTFANCADKMCHVYDSFPYMEHFANEHDLVARLGVLSPLRDGPDGLIEIDGPLYLQKGAWGHLLNQHHLMAIDDHLYPGSCRPTREHNPYPGPEGQKPRLYGYWHGKLPESELPPLHLTA